MNKKCKLPITFFLWDRLITSDNNLRQFYTIFLYHWTILPEDSSFFFTLPAILAHLYNWTSGNFPVMQQVPMLTVEQARRQHGSVWRTYRVLHVLLIWSCKYSCPFSLPTTGDVLQERCLHFGLIPVLMYMSLNKQICIWNKFCSRCKFVCVPGTWFCCKLWPQRSSNLYIVFFCHFTKKGYKSIKPIRAPDQTVDGSRPV